MNFSTFKRPNFVCFFRLNSHLLSVTSDITFLVLTPQSSGPKVGVTQEKDRTPYIPEDLKVKRVNILRFVKYLINTLNTLCLRDRLHLPLRLPSIMTQHQYLNPLIREKKSLLLKDGTGKQRNRGE